MQNIREINIWKKKDTEERAICDIYRNISIEELNLSVRSYNCLRRANCKTVGDIIDTIGSSEDGHDGLRRIRNLGQRSEEEILQKMAELKAGLQTGSKASQPSASPEEHAELVMLKPPKTVWNREITEFHLSDRSLRRLGDCGIYKVKDLYATNPKNEPGWYAVRELFMKITYQC